MRLVTPLLLLLAGITSAVSAQTPTPAALVAQLGDPHFQTREAAGKTLLALGERALPALEAGLSSDVPEVARRCEDLLPAVRQQIDADAILTPTMVDLPDGEQTLQRVFDSLWKQSPYELRVEGNQAVLSGKVKLTGGVMTFWEAVQAVCVAAKLDVHNVEARPPTATGSSPFGTVWLKAADDPPKRVTLHKALLIQVSPPSKDELARHPPTRSPLAVRTFPEPKVKWHRLTELELVKATDKSGQPISRAAVTYSTRPGGPIEFDPIEYRPRPTDATGGTLDLTAGPTEVAALSAVARFTAWKESGELAKVTFADKTGTADGPCGTRLTATVVGPVSNEPGSTMVEVKVRWDAERVRVEQSAAADSVWFENVNGRMVPVRATSNTPGTTAHGLRITNAAGEALTLFSGNVRIDAVTVFGRAFTEVSVKYVAKAGKLADGKPAAVSFHGARAVEVVVPFAAKDLPLTAGTRDPNERPRYKR